MMTPRDPGDAVVDPQGDTDALDSLEIEWMMMADWAEIIGGKLYIQGGGWNRIKTPPPGKTIDVAMAASIVIPWHRTNQNYNFALSIETGDGPELVRVEGGFNMARPARSVPGQQFRVPVSARASIALQGTGPYRARLTVDSVSAKAVTFYVVDEL